jgi:hypothetical protein
LPAFDPADRAFSRSASFSFRFSAVVRLRSRRLNTFIWNFLFSFVSVRLPAFDPADSGDYKPFRAQRL